jgi:ADP-heptose:LPS heptosyltransferase
MESIVGDKKKKSWKVKVKAWAMRRLCHKKSPQPLIHQSVESVLIMRYDRIGDMIVTTPLIHALRKHYSNARIIVLASQANYDVIAQNPYVDEVLVFPKPLFARLAVLMKLRARKLSMVVDLYHDLIWHAIIAIRLIHPAWVASSFKNNRYGVEASSLNLYDVMSEVDVSHPISEIYLGIAAALGANLDRDDYLYRLNPNAEQMQWVNANIKQGFNVGVNLFGSRPNMRLKKADCVDICQQILLDRPDSHILLITTHQTLVEMEDIKETLSSDRVIVVPPKGNIMFIAGLIGKLDLLISPDTSLVHIACAFQIPLVAVYVNSPALFLHWHPKHPTGRFKVLFSSEEKSLQGYSEVALKQAVREMLV